MPKARWTLSEPLRGGVRGHVGEDETSAVQGQDDEDIQDLEPDGGDHEHVDGDDGPSVVLEEAGPGLRPSSRRLGADAGQVAGHGALSDDVAELQELAVDSGAPQRKAVSLAHIIRSQTSLPAQIMNWKNRGWIKESHRADIVVLDLESIRTRTSISNPHQYSEGVEYLLVNGKVVIDAGEWNGTLAGEVIKLKK